MKCMVIVFVEDVCTYARIVRMFGEYNEMCVICARGIIGIGGHGKHTQVTKHVNKLGNKIFDGS